MAFSQPSTPIYASSFSESLPGAVGQMSEPRFPGSPINISQSYMQQTRPVPSPQGNTNLQSPIPVKAETDKQIMDKLTDVFGQKKTISYWPLLTFVVTWTVFGLVIFIIFLAAGKVGWGFYYLTTIIVMGIVFGMIIWVTCKDGYTTVGWVMAGLFMFIALGFIIWASVAYPRIKAFGQSPFGTSG